MTRVHRSRPGARLDSGVEHEGQDMADREVNAPEHHAPERERDVAMMRRALELAARGPLADANPRVGAVVLDRAGRVVGEGFHEGAGTPHAEASALRGRGIGVCFVSAGSGDTRVNPRSSRIDLVILDAGYRT